MSSTKTRPNDTSLARLDELLDLATAAADILVTSTPVERARWLEAGADSLDAHGDELVDTAMEESHLPAARLSGELRRTTFQLRLFAEVIREGAYLQATIDHADADWGMGPRPDLRRVMRPLGPVAVFAASNFPFAFSVAGGDTASALAAGNPVVVKGSPGHPRLSIRVAELLEAAMVDSGAPAGILALVFGHDAGRALVVDPRITAASFTGSIQGGRALFDLATSRPSPIPFFGELGSVNPVFVTESAARERSQAIAEGFIASVSLGSGQFCTKPGILFAPAHSDIAAIAADLGSNRPGAPMLNEGIRGGYARTHEWLATRDDVRVLAGSTTSAEDPTPAVLGTTLAEFLASGGDLATECFGPTALIVSYHDEQELLAAAESFEGQLTATIHGSPQDVIARDLLASLAERAGRVLWNGWPTGVSVTYAMHHGGPYPASTSAQTTSVGSTAIDRFVRPVTFQDMPNDLLPPALRDDNPWSLPRRVDGRMILADQPR